MRPAIAQHVEKIQTYHTELADYTKRYAQDVSEVANHNTQLLSEGRQTSEQATTAIARENAKLESAWLSKVEQIKAQYSAEVASFEQSVPGISQKSGQAAVKQAVAAKRGPVYQRLTKIADDSAQGAAKLEQTIREDFNQRWESWEQVVGPQTDVGLNNVLSAIKTAEKEILRGSPERIAVFRSILSESPDIQQASVFRGRAGGGGGTNVADIAGSRFATPETMDRIYAQL